MAQDSSEYDQPRVSFSMATKLLPNDDLQAEPPAFRKRKRSSSASSDGRIGEIWARSLPQRTLENNSQALNSTPDSERRRRSRSGSRAIGRGPPRSLLDSPANRASIASPRRLRTTSPPFSPGALAFGNPLTLWYNGRAYDTREKLLELRAEKLFPILISPDALATGERSRRHKVIIELPTQPQFDCAADDRMPAELLAALQNVGYPDLVSAWYLSRTGSDCSPLTPTEVGILDFLRSCTDWHAEKRTDSGDASQESAIPVTIKRDIHLDGLFKKLVISTNGRFMDLNDVMRKLYAAGHHRCRIEGCVAGWIQTALEAEQADMEARSHPLRRFVVNHNMEDPNIGLEFGDVVEVEDEHKQDWDGGVWVRKTDLWGMQSTGLYSSNDNPAVKVSLYGLTSYEGFAFPRRPGCPRGDPCPCPTPHW